MGDVKIYHRKITPSSGSVAWNLPYFHGELLSIHIKPTTSTTTYKFNMIGVNGLILYESRQGGVGELGELAQAHRGDFINEIVTCTLSAVSVDEEFDVEIRIQSNEL